MSILVTGGAGYIGSHLCVTLLAEGYDVVVVDNFSNSKPAVLGRIRELAGKDFSFYELDMLNRSALAEVIKKEPIEAVIHMAGLKAVGESAEEPLRYYETNLQSTLNLCSVMEEKGIRTFIFSSSATVYGIPESVPVREDAPNFALNPYGMTKLVIERILTDWNTAHPELCVALLRYFNPVGSHESGMLGEDPKGRPNNLMPFVARVASGKYDKVSVFGSDYPTKDGTGVRDYIHVMDLCEGHVAALRWAKGRTGTGIFNLGTGEGYSVLDMIHAFEKSCGKEIPYEIAPRRAGDAAVVYGDPSQAKKELHWQTSRSLEDMCRDTWTFIQKNPNGIE